ncbi:MAG: FkbM family methyltransferase [Halieaceae bacterium]|jgi:FkbM family methyltransferase|nr:FkbM family methyltransferase [Halieaceae bacterium]
MPNTLIAHIKKILGYGDSATTLHIPGFEGSLRMHTHPVRDVHISETIRQRGIWEPAETHFICRLLQSGDTFVDIGANIGYFTLIGSRLVGPRGKVIAFEPDRDNFNLLARNCKENHCHNAEIVEAALSDRNGEGALYINEDNRGDHTIYAPRESRRSTAIKLLSGSDYFHSQEEKIHFIKMDTQGSEYLVVRGLEETIASNFPGLVMLIEFSPNSLKLAGAGGLQLLELLSGLDSHFYILDSHTQNLFSISHQHLRQWVGLTEMDKDSEGFINLVVSGAPLERRTHIEVLDEPDLYENGLEHLLTIDLSPWHGEPCTVTNMNQYLFFASGWSFHESWGIWSDGEQSRIKFTLELTPLQKQQTVTLYLHGRYFGGEEQTQLYLNQHDLGSHCLIDCRITVDRQLLEETRFTLRLVHTNPLRPCDLGEGSDDRCLKFGWEKMVWISEPPC